MKFIFALAFLACASAQLRIVENNDVAADVPAIPASPIAPAVLPAAKLAIVEQFEVASDLLPEVQPLGDVEITPVKIVESPEADEESPVASDLFVVASDLLPEVQPLGDIEITPVRIVESPEADEETPIASLLPEVKSFGQVEVSPVKIVESLESEVAQEAGSMLKIVDKVDEATLVIEPVPVFAHPQKVPVPMAHSPDFPIYPGKPFARDANWR